MPERPTPPTPAEAGTAPAAALSRRSDLLYLQRYVFAEHFVGPDAGVLDYRCDGAFGATLLAPLAAHVTGICETAAAAERLRDWHGELGNVSFFGPAEYLNLGDRAFDLVTCFDPSLLSDFTEAVDQIRQFDRLLRPNGVLMLALPGEEQGLAARLRNQLRKSFRWVRAYQQRSQASSLLTDWPQERSQPGGVTAQTLIYRNGRAGTTAVDPSEPEAIILVASGAALPTGELSLLLDAPELTEASLNQRQLLAHRQPAAPEAEAAQLRAQLAELQERNRLLERHNRILAAATPTSTTPSPAGSGGPVSWKQRLKHRYWSFERLVYNTLSPRWRTRIARLRRSVLTRLGKGF